MPNEIQISGAVVFNSTNLLFRFQPPTVNADLANQAAAGGIHIIGTAAESLVITDVTTAGWSYFRNLSTAKDVDIGLNTSTFSALLTLKPGEFTICRLARTDVAVRANTANTNTVNLEWRMGSA
jgi:hypothetical protein